MTTSNHSQQLSRLTPHLYRYCSAGAAATVCHYIVFALLLPFTPALWASIAGALTGAIVSYACNYHWTFIATANKALSAKRFFIVATAHNSGNAFLMKYFLGFDVLHPVAAQLLVSGSLFFVSFFLHRFWSYTHE